MGRARQGGNLSITRALPYEVPHSDRAEVLLQLLLARPHRGSNASAQGREGTRKGVRIDCGARAPPSSPSASALHPKGPRRDEYV